MIIVLDDINETLKMIGQTLVRGFKETEKEEKKEIEDEPEQPVLEEPPESKLPELPKSDKPAPKTRRARRI